MSQRSRFPLLRATLLLLPACCLIGLVWFVTLNVQPAAEPRGGVAAPVRHQIATLDQRLREMVRAWRQNPRDFSVASWNTLLDAGGDSPAAMLLVSPRGVVTDSSMPNQVGIDLHDQAWFRAAQDRASRGDAAPVVSVHADDALHDWHLRVARWLQAPDRRFAGVLLADARLPPMNTLFRADAFPGGAAAPLIGAPAALQLQAGGISLLILALTGMLFVRGGNARREAAGLALDRGRLAPVGGDLPAAHARADALAAQLEATLAGVSDGVALLDPQLRLVAWNQNFADLAGVPGRLLQPGTSMEEILRAQAESGAFGRGSVQAEVARRLSVLRKLEPGQTAERTRPDGRVIALQRIRLPDGGSVTLYRDATAQRQAETAMREARALSEAATAAKARFVSVISQEIRAPLSSQLGTLRLLAGGSLPAAQQALLDGALQSGDTLLGLLDDILDMSRMEAGLVQLRPAACKLAPLLRSVVDLFQSQATERGITLRLAADPGLPEEIFADATRLRQVLINLVSNAVRFGVPGPVALLARQDQDEHGRSMLYLAVRDRGPVIEEAGRNRLFRPFSQFDLAGGEQAGSGLGLAICRYLVTLMGGGIGCRSWVADDRRTGNEFWVQLALAPVPAQAGRPADEPSAPPRLPRTRILLVEGGVASQLVTAMLLRREGHRVDVADTGETALRAMQQHSYDLVLAGLHLPGMGGVPLAQHIRALPGAAAQVPIVALSANTGPEDRIACEQAGIREVLDGPVVLPDLLDALRRHAWPGFPARGLSLDASRALPAPPLLAEQRLQALRAHLPPDALREMVQECLVDLQSRLPALRRDLLAGNGAEAANQAQVMMGMAAGYGMAMLEARLAALMVAARGPHASAATELLRQLEADLAHSAQAMRRALEIELA